MEDLNYGDIASGKRGGYSILNLVWSPLSLIRFYITSWL